MKDIALMLGAVVAGAALWAVMLTAIATEVIARDAFLGGPIIG